MRSNHSLFVVERVRLFPVLLVFIGVLVFAARLAAADESATASPVPVVQEKVEPIKVGMTAARSGAFAGFAREQLDGLRMWVADINGRGGLLNRPVQLVIYDDKSDPALTARFYETLISEDKVDLLVGPFSSELTLPASRVAEEHGFPIVVTGAAPEIWERGYRNVFGIYTPADLNVNPSLLKVALDNGLKRGAVVYADSAFPQAVAAGVRKRARENNFQLVFDREYTSDDSKATEFATLVHDLKQTNPEIVVVAGYLEDSIGFFNEAHKQRLEPKMLLFTGGPSLPAFALAVGRDNTEGVIANVQWSSGGRWPGGFDFAFRFKEIYGRSASYQAAGGYAAGQVLEAAASLGGTLDRDSLREQLSTLKFRSLFGHYRVDKAGRQIGKPSYAIQWQGGHRVLIAPEDVAEGRLLYPFPPWSERN